MRRFVWMAAMVGGAILSARGSVFAARAAALAPAEGKIRIGDVVVDRSAGTVSFPARVVKPAYLLEFFLCRAGTKEYESVLATDVRASDLHAAMLLLGLSPGLPAEAPGGVFLPPRGATVAVELRWTDPEGKRRSASAGDWLAPSGVENEKDGTDNRKNFRPPARWVFVGSEMLPGGGYLADQDGGIIAVANVAGAVFDVPLASTRALHRRRFGIRQAVVPPPGTAVEMLLRPDPYAARADYARALLEIGPRGEMVLDGQPIFLEALTAWAEKFSTRHKYARVVICSDAETPAGLAPLAQTELKLGGVYDVEFRVAPSALPLLPRTEPQLQAVLRQWRERLAQPEDAGEDPARQAERTLRQIERQREEGKRLDALWARYAEFLRTVRKRNAAASEGNDR